MSILMSTETRLVICMEPLNDWIASVTVCESVCAMLKRHNSTKFDRTPPATASAKSVSCTNHIYQCHPGKSSKFWSRGYYRFRSKKISAGIWIMWLTICQGHLYITKFCELCMLRSCYIL